MEKLKKLFLEIEKQCDDNFPESVIYILYKCGFESKIALRSITDESIKFIEQYFDDNFDELAEELIGYGSNRPFKLLPGHRAFIQNIPELMKKLEIPTVNSTASNEFSFVLKWMIETAESNATKGPKCRRFDENIQWFATYLYLMCGRACYETLCTNLPIPQANTICKCVFAFNKIAYCLFFIYLLQ